MMCADGVGMCATAVSGYESIAAAVLARCDLSKSAAPLPLPGIFPARSRALSNVLRSFEGRAFAAINTSLLMEPGVIGGVIHCHPLPRFPEKNLEKKRRQSTRSRLNFQPEPTAKCRFFLGFLFRGKPSFSTTRRRCSALSTPSSRSRAALTADVKVWSTPANRPPLEPGASCAHGRQVSRGHTNGHTHEVQGCHHEGRECMCWGSRRRVGPCVKHRLRICRCPPAKLTKRKMRATCPTTRLASSAGAGAQPPCTTTFYSPAQVPLNFLPFTQITLHTLSQTQSGRASRR